MNEAILLSLIQVAIGLLDLVVGFLALCEMSPPKTNEKQREPAEGELKPNHED